MAEVILTYDGALASSHAIDLYDAAKALEGFQRSLALVAHLVLTGKVITKATALADAQILTRPPEDGSWKATAWIVGAAFTIGSVGKDSPVGQIVTSVYDYVLNETMGFHVDYEKTIQQQYEEHFRRKKITTDKLDSLMEKTESSIVDLHRPIFYSGSATKADIRSRSLPSSPIRKLGPDLSMITYEYIAKTERSDDTTLFVGSVSSYNINTYRGRFFSTQHGRPVPFELMESAKTIGNIDSITASLSRSAAKRNDPRALISIEAYTIQTSTGRLKVFHVVDVGGGASNNL